MLSTLLAGAVLWSVEAHQMQLAQSNTPPAPRSLPQSAEPIQKYGDPVPEPHHNHDQGPDTGGGKPFNSK